MQLPSHNHVETEKSARLLNDIPLDRDTARGLFETRGGNRYVVVDDIEGKVAIRLRHHSCKAFVAIPLTARALAHGNELGNCELELTHRTIVAHSRQKPGMIGVDEGGASILCFHKADGVSWRGLGTFAFSDAMTEYDG